VRRRPTHIDRNDLSFDHFDKIVDVRLRERVRPRSLQEKTRAPIARVIARFVGKPTFATIDRSASTRLSIKRRALADVKSR
jgi:hypothetical protein